MTPAPIEPAADIRQMANALRQVFLALMAEGFTEQQSLIIVGQIIATNSAGS